ncbi:MAG: ABC transporter permease subunit [Candidatus Aminicenantes bacterium]|nr:ABC transporter permease subunit [Candidatus Aminicenantes bacterium]
MKENEALCVVFSTFFRTGLKAKRTRVFILLGLVPVLLMLAVRVMEGAGTLEAGAAAEFFARVTLALYFQLLVPVLALFFGSSIVNEELDNKTLVYLTTVPVRRRTVLLGKFLAAFLLAALLVAAGFLLCFLSASLRRLGQAAAWGELGLFLGAALLALLCYMALFSAAGAFMKKSILIGLFFIFGWESVVQYFPGVTQKFTIVHWVKSLLPIPPGEGGFLIFQLQPSPPLQSILALLFAGALFLALSVFIFERKEYIFSDNA